MYSPIRILKINLRLLSSSRDKWGCLVKYQMYLAAELPISPDKRFLPNGHDAEIRGGEVRQCVYVRIEPLQMRAQLVGQ